MEEMWSGHSSLEKDWMWVFSFKTRRVNWVCWTGHQQRQHLLLYNSPSGIQILWSKCTSGSLTFKVNYTLLLCADAYVKVKQNWNGCAKVSCCLWCSGNTVQGEKKHGNLVDYCHFLSLAWGKGTDCFREEVYGNCLHSWVNACCHFLWGAG